jgi:carbamate kinase
MPLDICGADSQGGIGYMIQQVLQNELARAAVQRPVVTLVTQVEVDPNDPAFQNPTKPIGPFYRPGEAAQLAATKGWQMRDDAGRGMRRVVPSPRPLRIVEIEVIRTLVDDGVIVNCCRGRELAGVEAVIDKDHTAAVLATQLRATRLILLTGVETVMRGFGTSGASPIHALTLAEAESLLQAGEFPAGSMGPKIRAGLDFLRAGGEEVVITDPQHLSSALAGATGTHIAMA